MATESPESLIAGFLLLVMELACLPRPVRAGLRGIVPAEHLFPGAAPISHKPQGRRHAEGLRTSYRRVCLARAIWPVISDLTTDMLAQMCGLCISCPSRASWVNAPATSMQCQGVLRAMLGISPVDCLPRPSETPAELLLDAASMPAPGPRDAITAAIKRSCLRQR
jgi:hypothetical protein